MRYTISQEPNDTGWIVTAYHDTNEPEVSYFPQLDAALIQAVIDKATKTA